MVFPVSRREIRPQRQRRQLSFAALLLLLSLPTGAEAQEPAADGLPLLRALELALQNDPNIAAVQIDTWSARSRLEAERAAFDPSFTAGLTGGRDSGVDPSRDSLDARAGANLALRSGLSLESAVTLSRAAEDGPEAAANSGSLSVTLRQPLLRGRGEKVVTTNEKIAEQELAATREDLAQQVATRLRTVAGLYWSYLAAAEDVEILRDTEERAQRFLENTRRLVAADLTPAADLVQLEANLLARELARRAGERRLFEARQNLGREIGLPAAVILTLPPPSDPYPPLLPEEAPKVERAGFFLDLSLASRADLRAARLRIEESRLRLAFLENALAPRLDLVLTPSYSNSLEGGGVDDFFAPLTRDIPGFAATLGLSWSFSPPNRLARANLETQQASLRRGELALRQIELQIGADVPTALHGVAYSAELLARSQDALDLFQRALDNEEKKLRAGSSTLIDVLNQQDQLISARQRVNDARLGLALALLRLRFETGTLVASPDTFGEPARVDLEAFLTLPQPPR